MGPIEKDDHFIPNGMNAFERNVKRIDDCVLALGALVVFSLLFLLCYIVVKREDGDPAISKQERIGRFDRPLNIYKFRSMKLDAERHDPILHAGKGDSCMTKVGRFLHNHHLGEPPQLWSMFCGNMTSTGPRPGRQFFINQIMKENPRYRCLFQTRPGVTSYATPYNGYTDILEKILHRLRYDLFYLEYRSQDFNIRMLFVTFMNIVFGKKF